MIVVTSPTGLIGQQVVEELLRHGEAVRVIVRDPSRLAGKVRDQAEVALGSHAERAVVDQAFGGADAVFWLVPPDPRAHSVEAAYVEFSRPAAEALVRHRVRRVVNISALGRGLPLSAGYVTASLAVDDLLADTGVHFRALTMPSFMDNLLRQVGTVKSQGTFYSPISGERKLPSVATRDIASVAAGWLLDHTWTGRGEVPVLGPEDLSFNDMAQIMSEVLGTPVRFQQITPEAYTANMTRLGMSGAMAQGMLDMATAKDQGLDNAEPRTPHSSTPTSFRQWCEDTLRPAVQG